jgi:hypothetical protein
MTRIRYICIPPIRSSETEIQSLGYEGYDAAKLLSDMGWIVYRIEESWERLDGKS